MGLKIKSIIISFLIVINYTATTNAAWEGPTEVVSGGWGTEIGRFRMVSGDTADDIPSMIVISSTGKILIGDGFNKRIQVFNTDGSFSNIITPKGFPTTYPAATYWPLSLFICGDSNIYTERNEYIQIYNMNGDLVQNFKNLDGGIVHIDQQCNFYTYNPSTKTYSLYSPTGALIRTTTERPLELGKVKEKKTAGGYTYTIQYPDLANPDNVKTYTITPDRQFLRFFRDNNNNIYGINPGGVWKYNERGEFVDKLIIPKTQYGEPKIIGVERIKPILEEYGDPIISPTGDVYTWKRTQDRYSIIKWTWRP